MSVVNEGHAMTAPALAAIGERGDTIVMVTAYDYTSARIADAAGIDAILVGDSLAMTMLGYEDTLSLTIDDTLVFAKAVRRGCQRALVVVDLPFGSYCVSVEQAIESAVRLVKEGDAGAVKLEGGLAVAPAVRRIVDAGIPVMGHIGLTPQHKAATGGFRVQARTADGAQRLLDDARAIEEAGAFAIVVEGVPSVVGAAVTRSLTIPTIGIGAGDACTGQILVWHDVLGLYSGRTPRFVRQYADGAGFFAGALEAYSADVRAGRFPGVEHTYNVAADEHESVARVLAGV